LRRTSTRTDDVDAAATIAEEIPVERERECRDRRPGIGVEITGTRRFR
jgi:hypothetical protein